MNDGKGNSQEGFSLHHNTSLSISRIGVLDGFTTSRLNFMFTGFAEWVYDERSGYHFNAATGYYYDPNSGLYYSDILGMVFLHLMSVSDSRSRPSVITSSILESSFSGVKFISLTP